MKSLLPLAAAAALSLGVYGEARAEMAPYTTIAHWRITADAELCKASGEYQDGTVLNFYINAKGAAAVGIENQKWTTLPKGTYEVTMQVDRAAPTTLEAKAGPGWVVWLVPFDEPTINLLSYGNMLYVQVGSQKHQYKLDRSEAAWKALGQCAAPRMAAANPFAGSPPTAASKSPPASTETPSNPFRRM